MECRRIDILKTTEFGEYRQGNIVEIKTIGTYSRIITGRINNIATCEMELDLSDKYESKNKIVKYDEISSISLCETL